MKLVKKQRRYVGQIVGYIKESRGVKKNVKVVGWSVTHTLELDVKPRLLLLLHPRRHRVRSACPRPA
ncbi:MAG: hypothetical protein Q8P11_04405 [bacterium]|nr:hypothetical protein [bacterium]